MTLPVPPHRFLHPDYPRVPYRHVNSRRGVLEAHAKGYRWIDLDCQVTNDDVLVITHWAQPLERDAFKDPRRTIDVAAKVGDLTWAEVRRLRTDDGYRILEAHDLIAFANALGVRVELELKSNRVTPALMGELHASLARPRMVWVKTLSDLPGSAAHRLRAARPYFKTIILPRGPVPRAVKPYATFRRGHVTWVS